MAGWTRLWSPALVAVAGLAVLAGVGCSRYPYGDTSPITQRIHAPPQGHHPYPSPGSVTLANMVDAGVYADMSLVDRHFVTGTSEISDLGQYRLDSVARVLEAHPMITVNVYTETGSVVLEGRRVDAVRERLNAMLSRDDVDVSGGLGVARGITAKEGVEILKAMRARVTEDAEEVDDSFTP